MASAITDLTVHEFDALYGGQADWEYWFGEARSKPVPTKLHCILQFLLSELLLRAGYIVSGESNTACLACHVG